jgi:transmembrane sensor
VTDAATVRRQVALADGSVLHVNAATALRVELGARERRVALENGEAHFAVAPDQARPFVVAAGGLRIRAVGTAFDVRAVGDEVQVIVHEGRVEVATDGRISGAPSPILAAGERVVARAGRVQPVERLDAPALRTALAWHGATVVFIDTPLRDVVARFNAHNTLQLTLADPALAARRIGGTFSLDRVDALVSLLEQEGDVAVERRPGDNAVVLRRK